MKYFEVGDCGIKHEIDNPNCHECWHEPSRCKCGGLIHTEFGDEDYDGDYWLYHKCDRCGEDWEYE